MSSTDTEKTAIITWTESTPDYNMCLNWLAQCKRRLYYPLDTSERLSSNDENLGAEALVDLLDVFRNARIHGQWGTGRTYFARLPRITYELCIHLLSGKTQNDIDAIIALVETRKKHLIDEIKSNISGF